MDQLRTRVVNALHRNYDPGTEYTGWSLTDDEVIAIGQAKSDLELMRLRNFGVASLSWLRQQPVLSPPPQVTQEAFIPLSITKGEWLDYLGRRTIDYAVSITKMLREAAVLLEDELSWHEGAADLVGRIKQTLREEDDANR